MKNIVFRVDASVHIGSGHMMRCLTLADRLTEKGCRVTFISRRRQGDFISYLTERGYEVKPLPDTVSGNQPGPEHSWLGEAYAKDAEQTLEAMRALGSVDYLIVDHYGIDYRWERLLREHVKKLMVIDDLDHRRHECDWLLNQNFVSDSSYAALREKKQTLFLGPKYALLRKEFAIARQQVQTKRSTVNRILITFGGTDPTNETMKVLQAVTKLPESIMFDVVAGAANPNRKKIEQFAASMENVDFYCQINNISQLMLNADIAICSGGSTTWERYCLGLPGVVITVADNQVGIARKSAELEIDRYLGHFNEVTAESLLRAIRTVLNDKNTLWLAGEKARQIVDGNGVNRVCERLLTAD
ncbi:UDP-2,4-diacetamido-2,4,6-trideoxy-beta-L-altropyranose hydrolase [Evansella caseinilytica]|uniref:UDP-2,4-diacetamido-2,4,6-trideoxy-beta-L-altropyranose hydrolase n=1 Tax=Evansella caseinilytica TaxID=1503961 RepID=A0A1H3S768_9BACI|nr:UDP-2,4-diacetamido-2,4,6-trideoxy-beta-L-altropyranose hydrolase [Evansella caseinilytica]SDZ33597.1 UDP-2,4-diacetamido-2,4,6-trideoxy-beta-L-altropyranose hydrolase [Evansella caseinilytica]